MKSLFNLICVFLISYSIGFSQNGTIRGTMTELKTGDPILFGTVYVPSLSDGTTTDLDGTFSLSLAAGTYTLEFSYLGLRTKTITDVIVEAGKVQILNVSLEDDSQLIEEVVVTAKASRNTEVALATLKRNSNAVIDGISSGNFKKIGDSDAASAMKRVTGVSVEGGKYVYVRGLGDRYTKSILNGMDVPGLDPDRNSLQMDIFPTNILDNIIVLKSFTADLPADFTGGVININTKDFPEQRTASVSGGIGYNPGMHFNSNYLTSSTSGTDFLGFDDGLRDIPTNRSLDVPFRTDALVDPNGVGQKYRTILEGFNPNLAVSKTNSFMDYNFGFSLGNQKEKKNYTLGYNFGLSYQNSSEYYDDVQYNIFGKDRDQSQFQMEERISQKGSFGANNVLIAAIGGFSIKTTTSKYSLTMLRIQNGESKNGIFDYSSTDFGANFTGYQHNIEYSERAITNAHLKGVHTFDKGKWNVQWNLAPTFSTINDPDIRITRYRNDGGNLTIGTESGIPERSWRFLEEVNYNGNAHVTREYKYKEKVARIKFGSNYSGKQRDYEIQNFQIYTNALELNGNPDEIFEAENLWSPENTQGVTFDPQFLPINTNKFNSSSSNIALYVSNEMYVTPKLKTVIGLRGEQFNQYYTGRNQSGETFNNSEVFNKLNLFPTANFIYELKENQNLRVSYSRTIARPSFKESSYATILDPISGRTFIGGFFKDINVTTGDVIWDGKLVSTDIDNLDLRWEMFQEKGQSISISSFYKMFKNPIEIVQYVQAAGNFQPRNVGDGTVLGLELEMVKNLAGLGSTFSDISFNLNTTVVKSSIKMSASELLTRELTARDGEEVSNTRAMAGQAPFIVNGGLSYKNPSSKIEFGAFYNVQGRTLKFVGAADRPDVYSVPFHSLNLNFNMPFGADDRFNIGCKMNNVLNSQRQEVFSAYNADDQIFTNLNPGTSFSVRFGCKL